MRVRVGDDECEEHAILTQRRLETHIEEFRIHTEVEQARWEKLLSAQENNSDAIRELTESTKDIVDAWQATSGAIKVSKNIGRFIKWISGFAVVGAAIHWLSQFAPK